MPAIHNIDALGSIALAGNEGNVGDVLTSAGPGAQAVWTGTVGLYQDFGAAGNLGPLVNDEVQFVNTGGFHSIGFEVLVPVGGRYAFEGTYNGTSWVPITMLATDANGYVQNLGFNATFRGSIATLRAFRVRTIVAGGAPGTVVGRASDANNFLDGIVTDALPSNFGQFNLHVGFEFTTPQTGTVIGMSPPPEYLYALTDLQFSVSGSGRLTFFDETDNVNNWIFTSDYKVPTDQTEITSLNFGIPFVSSVAGNSFKITTTGSITIVGTGHGYGIPAVV